MEWVLLNSPKLNYKLMSRGSGMVSKTKLKASDRLRALIRKSDVIIVPGVFNAITARLAQRVGFQALYFSGGALANSMALPDLGVTTLSEVVENVVQITRVVNAPLIVDGDTGFGEAVNVMRAIQMLEDVGVAAVHIEDQVLPKKCGHLPGKMLVDTSEMVKKLLVALESRKRNIVLIARTDARAVEGLDGAIERARSYAKAGADVIFPEALESKEEFGEFAKKVPGVLMANMTEYGKTPYLRASEFGELGYKIVVFPMTAFRAMLKATEGVYTELKKNGTQIRLLPEMMSREQVYDLIGYYDFVKADDVALRKAKRILESDQ
jgi:methylisocitrate lyase